MGKNLTIDILHCQKVLVLDWCYMCKRARETLDHLLLHYDYACVIWSFVFCLFGVSWVMPSRDAFAGLLERELFQEGFGCYWSAVSLCLMWMLWRERNRRVF